MDDRNFDLKSASEWIKTIESEAARVREGDIYPKLREWIRTSAPRVLLEIGSGQGACADEIDLSECRYTGIEPSPFLLKRAKELHPEIDIRFIEGNAYNLPFPDGTFDAAFSITVWHLLSDLTKASRELSRILKSHGHFLIITADPAHADHWVNPNDTLYLPACEEIINTLCSVRLETQFTEVFRKFILIRGQKLP